MQNHGGPTRLLDWLDGALIALTPFQGRLATNVAFFAGAAKVSQRWHTPGSAIVWQGSVPCFAINLRSRAALGETVRCQLCVSSDPSGFLLVGRLPRLNTQNRPIRIPSFSFNSLAMRSSPQVGFSATIFQIRSRRSLGKRRLPVGLYFKRQKCRNPLRCGTGLRHRRERGLGTLRQRRNSESRHRHR